jgi:hypothetical protein
MPHYRDEEIMDSDDATIIEEWSRHQVVDPSVPRHSPPRGVDLGLHAATVILASVPPPRGWIHRGSCNDDDGDWWQ